MQGEMSRNLILDIRHTRRQGGTVFGLKDRLLVLFLNCFIMHGIINQNIFVHVMP